MYCQERQQSTLTRTGYASRMKVVYYLLLLLKGAYCVYFEIGSCGCIILFQVDRPLFDASRHPNCSSRRRVKSCNRFNRRIIEHSRDLHKRCFAWLGHCSLYVLPGYVDFYFFLTINYVHCTMYGVRGFLLQVFVSVQVNCWWDYRAVDEE